MIKDSLIIFNLRNRSLCMVPSMLPYVTDFEKGKKLDLGFGGYKKCHFFNQLSIFDFEKILFYTLLYF